MMPVVDEMTVKTPQTGKGYSLQLFGYKWEKLKYLSSKFMGM